MHSRDERAITGQCTSYPLDIPQLIYPCLALLSDRGDEAAEAIGAMPTPTAMVTVVFLLAARHQCIDLMLLVISVLWCLLDAVTINTMRQPDWWVSPTILILAISISALFVTFSCRH